MLRADIEATRDGEFPTIVEVFCDGNLQWGQLRAFDPLGRSFVGVSIVAAGVEWYALSREVKGNNSNVVERMALAAGIEAALAHGCTHATFLTDSSLLPVIARRATRDQLVVWIRDRMARFESVRLEWIPRQANHRADYLAKPYWRGRLSEHRDLSLHARLRDAYAGFLVRDRQNYVQTLLRDATGRE